MNSAEVTPNFEHAVNIKHTTLGNHVKRRGIPRTTMKDYFGLIHFTFHRPFASYIMEISAARGPQLHVSPNALVSELE
jgi:predicted solute-binding protein